jgi:hypothetical protein
MAEKTPFPMARYAEMLFEAGRRFIGLSALSHPSVMVSAFTPTDAMAVLGLYNVGSREAAVLGAELLGRRLKLSADQTARRVLDEFGRLLAQEIMSYGFENDGLDFDPTAFAEKGIFGGLLGRREHGHIKINAATSDTVILLGAPASVLAPFVGKYLAGRLLVPPIFEVASAVGAAASPIHLSRRVEIHTLPNFTGYRLFLPDEVIDGANVDSLARTAQTKMETYMRGLAAQAGAAQAQVSVTRDNRLVLMNDGSKLNLGASLNFVAVGTGD